MGQGRKKCDRSGRNCRRRRSFSYESDNRESEELRNLLGATPVGRMRAAYNRRTSRRQCSAAFFKPARHNSLVDYISPQSVNAIPVKPVSFSSLPSASELPLISTSPETQSGSIKDFNKSRGVQLLMESIFPNNTVYMNGKGRDITPERHGSISSLLRQLVSENEIEIDLASYAINSTSFSPSHTRSKGLCPLHIRPQNQSHSLLSRPRLSLRKHLRLLLASCSSSRSLRLHARYICQGLSHALRDTHRLQRKRKGNSHLS